MEYVYCNYRFAREIYNKEPEELIGQTIQALRGNLTQ